MNTRTDVRRSQSRRSQAATSLSNNLRIVVLGYIVRYPLGGMAWHHLQYVLGLARAGHDVYFLEQSEKYPSCYDPTVDSMVDYPSYGLQFAACAFEKLGLSGRWAYYDAHTTAWIGPCAHRIREICAKSDIVLNVSGVNELHPWFMEIPVRIFIDTDPVFTQIRHLTDSVARDLALQHTAHFSFGENIGKPQCTIPDDGLSWQPTRQPIVLDAWPVTAGFERGKYTTVMHWDSYPARENNGRRYGTKPDSFEGYINLPKRAGRIFQLAVGGRSAPRSLLIEKGWLLENPLVPTQDLWTYQRYIQQSKGEFSIAKHGYVVSRSGWFSERSAAYLASGRPVVVQDTGFSDWLNTGAGVFPFEIPEEVIRAIAEINTRYEFHCAAARDVAQEYFDAQRVLQELIESGDRFTDRPSDSSY